MERKLKNVSLGRVGDRPLWALHLSNVTRAVHQVGAAVFLTSFLFPGRFQLPLSFTILVCTSGIVLFGFEGLRHRQIFRELTGMVTLIKMGLIGLAFHGFGNGALLVLIAYVAASLSSHAPRDIRHRLLF